MASPEFVTIEEGIEEIRAGRMLIVVDDEDRENEGDLLMAAEKATPEAVNFMAKHGRGLICMPMLGERLDELQVSMMVSDNTAPLGTAFTVSVDARRGVTTGTSAYDRAVTIRTLVDPSTRAEDLTRPGHIFPLRAMPGGVLRRAGHTEAAVDLTEGKFHQVKRMFEAVGKRVIYLKRISMGPLELDETLELGEYRELNDEELDKLMNYEVR